MPWKVKAAAAWSQVNLAATASNSGMSAVPASLTAVRTGATGATPARDPRRAVADQVGDEVPDAYEEREGGGVCDTGGVGDCGFAGGVAAGAGSELNVDAQLSPVTMGSTVGVGAVDAHVGFVDDPAQADRVGGGSAVNCGGEEEFSVSDFSD
jgi:hypothetical protein